MARRLGAASAAGAGEPTFRTIGSATATGQGRFVFTDAGLPAGAASATYLITGRRGRVRGESGEAVEVRFGVGGMQMPAASAGTIAPSTKRYGRRAAA